VIPLRDANPTRRTPYITLTLIGASIMAFAWELGVLARAGEDGLHSLFLDHGVVPADLSAALSGGQVVSGPTVAILTSLFLHGDWIHLAGNLLYLWIFGNNIEDRLGPLAFLGFYLLGGVAAALAQVAIDPASRAPLIGASGAIAATLGAYLVLYPRARILSLVLLGFFYQLIEIPALLVLGFWFVLQLFDGVASLGAPTAGGAIAFFAHIGGFVAGALVALAVRAIGARSLRSASVG